MCSPSFFRLSCDDCSTYFSQTRLSVWSWQGNRYSFTREERPLGVSIVVAAHNTTILWTSQMLPWGRFFHLGQATSHSELLILARQADSTVAKFPATTAQCVVCMSYALPLWRNTLNCLCFTPRLMSNSLKLAARARRGALVASQTWALVPYISSRLCGLGYATPQPH